MKAIILLTLCVVLSGCASTVPLGSTHRQYSVGEDSYYEIYAENFTKGEAAPAPPVVVLNARGTKILGAFPSDPLAGMLTGHNVTIKVGKQQSNAFGKAIGALNNWIAGWTAVTGLKEATAQRASDNALKATQASEATAQTALQTAPTVIDPAAQAVSRAGGAVVIP